MHYSLEAVIVGVLIVFIGYPIFYLMSFENKSFEFGSKLMFLATLFILGFIGHIVGEFSGINEWYWRSKM